MSKYSHLIIGCGYLGKSLLSKLPTDACWFTNRRHPQHNSEYQIILDVNNSETWTALDTVDPTRKWAVYFMLPPSQIDIEQFPVFLKRLSNYPLEKAILVSSTVVYGQQEREVDGDSEVLIDSDRAERQYQIEQCWFETISGSCIVRMAGLYGPGRIIGRKLILENRSPGGNPEAWLNLIHINDAASLLCCMVENSATIELGCDGHPIKRRDYYKHIASVLGKPAPVFDGDNDANGRRCNNKVTMERTGWSPEYEDVYLSTTQLLRD